MKPAAPLSSTASPGKKKKTKQTVQKDQTTTRHPAKIEYHHIFDGNRLGQIRLEQKKRSYSREKIGVRCLYLAVFGGGSSKKTKWNDTNLFGVDVGQALPPHNHQGQC